MTNKTGNVTIDTSFEVGFELPTAKVRQAPPLLPGQLPTLDRVGTRTLASSKEAWCLIFDLEDAEEVAATFEELSVKIRQHIKTQ